MSNAADQTPHQKRRGHTKSIREYVAAAERERENDERYEDLENEFQAGKRDWREVEKKFNHQIGGLREELGRYERRLDDVEDEKHKLESVLEQKDREINDLKQQLAISERNTYNLRRMRNNLDEMERYIHDSRARWVEEDKIRKTKWDGFFLKGLLGRGMLILKWVNLIWLAISGVIQFVLAIRGEKRASKEE
ncbi:uncharacterized protein EAE98_007127 [Botrytis deweyae]|uniref:Uncharacterized protein n=1 Tax=Botrytis deweyae TaxID=2478750 RepID=A0ABQ7IJ19_9HELO|nr:uncharacterized protein EAE98_007127 [Botrytis deweyae]KAF7925039.1 hypothetical protein EAE98_007127 [Botrytis deweyae]